MANVRLLPFLNEVYDRQPPRRRFRAETPEEWRAWRTDAGGSLRDMLALDTVEEHRWPDAPPPQVSTLEEGPDYRIERVLLPTLRGVWMPCLVLVPNAPPPYPAVLCLHGHGMSKDMLAGTPRDEAERERMELLRGDFAAKFARAGYLAIAPDAAGFGERVEDVSLGQTKNNCQHLAVNALSLGMSLQGIRVWEILRALDYLWGRPGRASGPHRVRRPVHGMRARDVRRSPGRANSRISAELRSASNHPRCEAHLLVRVPLLAGHLQRDGLA